MPYTPKNGRKKGWAEGEDRLLSLSPELLRMRLCLGDGRVERLDAAIPPSGNVNSLQLDTFKKLLIPYGKLSISAVLATAHLVCRLPLAIKLFLSDYLLSQTGWSLWSEVQAACSKQGACAKVRRGWGRLTGCISWRLGSKSEKQLGRETARCSEQENITTIVEGRVADRD